MKNNRKQQSIDKNNKENQKRKQKTKNKEYKKEMRKTIQENQINPDISKIKTKH